MRRVIALLTVVFIVQLTACKKDQAAQNTGLTGKWKQTGNLISNGGSLYYVAAPVKADYDYAQFNTDGTVTGTVFSDYSTYTTKDSTTLIFTKSDKTTIQNYRYLIKGDSLKMSPAGPILCIEGCAIIFVKVR